MTPARHFILFVDDEQLVLRGIQRSISEYCDNWVADFALSGQEALDKISRHEYDAVVSDMYMPGMDGVQLLEAVRQSRPGIIRFVLSGNTSEAQVMKSTHLVHQMIPKPCDIEKIYAMVERACSLRDTLSDPALLNIITGIKNLPSVPRLYNQLVEKLETDTTSAQMVGDIIAQDAAMTAKILQLVNSAFFGISEQVSSPQKAVTLLGFNLIKSLVLGIQVFSEYQPVPSAPVSADSVWKHSLLVSSLTASIARALNLSSSEREEARVAGILHDIGLLLGFNIPGFFTQVKIDHNGQTVVESEYKFLGTSHAEMGGYLLGIWGLPDPIVEAVAFHHHPRRLGGKPNLLTALHVANGLVNMCQNEAKTQYAPYVDLPYIQDMRLEGHLDEWVRLTRGLLKSTGMHGGDEVE